MTDTIPPTNQDPLTVPDSAVPAAPVSNSPDYTPAYPSPAVLDMPPAPQNKKPRKVLIISAIVAAVIICLCLTTCLIMFGRNAYMAITERDEIHEVLHLYMELMKNHAPKQAYELFSSRVKRVDGIYEELEKMTQGANATLFEGYQEIEMRNINITTTANTNQDLPQGQVANVSGVIHYDDGFDGTFTAVLELEEDAWKIYYINVTVPPEKILP